MLKKWISTTVISVAFVFSAFNQTAIAKDLPDFTELAEKHGAEVVNISVTQVVQGGGNGAMPFPGMPDDENLQEFFKRFGIPEIGRAHV